MEQWASSQAPRHLPGECTGHLTSLSVQGGRRGKEGGLVFLRGPSLHPRVTKPAGSAASATTTGNQSVVERQMGVENPLRDVRSLLSPVLKITRFIRD